MLQTNNCHKCHKNERKVIKVNDEESYSPILCDECAMEIFGDIEPDKEDCK